MDTASLPTRPLRQSNGKCKGLQRNRRELTSPRLRRAQRVRRIMNANLFRRGFGVHGAESIQRVQRRNFVALGECWIVEDGVHKIIQTAAQR